MPESTAFPITLWEANTANAALMVWGLGLGWAGLGWLAGKFIVIFIFTKERQGTAKI